MSIYATQHEFAIPVGIGKTSSVNIGMTAMALVYVQAVPGFVGHPDSGYETDPYPWLPSAPSKEEEDRFRGVYFVAAGDASKTGQQYDRPLLIMSHDEYVKISYLDLITRLTEELRWRWSNDEINSNSIFYVD